MGPRIVVDQSAGFNQGAGIGRYARNLVPELVESLPDASVTLWYAPAAGAPFFDAAIAPFADSTRVTMSACRWNRRRMDQLWFRARAPLPIELWTGRHDLVYSPDFTAPPSLRTPNIITIHDLAFLIVPERAPDGLRRYLSSVAPAAAERAAAIVAVSETTKRDIVRELGITAAKITVVPNAVDERFFHTRPLDNEQRKRLGIPERYFLTVGTIEPRKNHETLFAALRTLPVHVNMPLVVAGQIGWSADSILENVKSLQREGKVIMLDYVDDRWLPGLYAGASALVYPSWYEGFGLPVLEGMAAGVRVIASDVPAHREVGAGTLTLIQPDDPEAIGAALTAAANSQDEPEARDQRVERARLYSWASSGKTLAALVKSVLAS